jgi:hypothetical protein
VTEPLTGDASVTQYDPRKFIYIGSANKETSICLVWHDAPVEQYVVTLTGVLVFITTSGETCTIVPGVVLLGEDLTGTGHEWQMIGDDPWRRAYMIFPPGVDTQFVPDLT